jgi:copper chaperone CopZ
MESIEIFVENIKCCGCMNSIRTTLLKLEGVRDVQINKETDRVSVSGEQLNRETVINKLATLGYPEKGNNSLMSKAKSMVSCAVGRITD